MPFGIRTRRWSSRRTPRDRDRILNNIATGFRYLGLLDVARDAYLVLAATAQEQYVRWMSEINLMELAAQQGSELQFDRYRRDLESADFTPHVASDVPATRRSRLPPLGNPEAGIPYLERAIALAETHKLNQLMFEAEDALGPKPGGASVKNRRSQTASEFDPSVQYVVDAIHDMKELAGI